ncbi:MAG: caspase family protein [Rhizomicrobium sp.]
MSYAPDDYALVIGIDHYPKWANGERSLKGAVNDAKDFHKWLIDPSGGGLNQDNARLVLSTEKPISPLQQIIDKEFTVVRERSKGKLHRRFYFYFSGHGYSRAGSAGDQVLCLANWSLEDQGAALQLSSYLNASVGCIGFEEGLFFLDCCRVREVAPIGKTSDLECGDPKFAGKDHTIFYATEHYQPGYEDDTPDVRGYFTKALLAILRRGTIEVTYLGKLLRTEVSELARPNNQGARTDINTTHDIFLGPPVEPPPQHAGNGGPSGPLGQLSILLETHLTTNTSPEEPPAPSPGQITVLRGDAIVGTGRGSFSAALPLGKYSVRIAHGEAFDSREVDLKGNETLQFPLPRRISAAPLSSTVDKREYITDPIMAASRQPDRVAGQSIFVATRARYGALDAKFAGELWIEDGTFSQQITQGLAMLPAREGMYELQYREIGGSTLTLSIPVVGDWDTQVFIVADRGRPILERASIFMQPAGKGFDPSDGLIDAYELALSDLVSGGPGPDRATLDHLLEGKFRNPLFGLVGAQFLLRELRLEKTRADSRYNLLDIVIQNMSRLLGENNPDVMALYAGRAQLHGESLADETSNSPPLLRTSFQALIEATADRPELFDSLFDEVALGMVAESPWTCWRTRPLTADVSGSIAHATSIIQHYISMKPGPRLNILELILTDEGFRVSRTLDGKRHRLHAVGAASATNMDFKSVGRLATVPGWVVDAMRFEIEQSARIDRPIDMKNLVRRLGLPRGLLDQARRIVRHEAAPESATPTDTKMAKLQYRTP